MSNDAPEGVTGGSPERGARRSPRLGDSGAPIGSTLAIVLALVAVVAGFLILRAITDDDDDGSSSLPGATPGVDTQVGQTTTTSAGGAGTTVVTTTTLADVKTGATVIVANANSVGGSAGRITRALGNAGYTVIDPTDASGAEDQLDESKVYFAASDAAAQAVANSVARTLGGVNVAPLPAEIPVDGGDIGEATVLVMLGDDAADKTLKELAPDEAPGATTPAVAGGTTTTVAE